MATSRVFSAALPALVLLLSLPSAVSDAALARAATSRSDGEDGIRDIEDELVNDAVDSGQSSRRRLTNCFYTYQQSVT